MKFVLLLTIFTILFGCNSNNFYPVAPTFDSPIVSELDIYLDDGAIAGKLKFGPILVPIHEPDKKNNYLMYPTIVNNICSASLPIYESTYLSIYLVRANISNYLNDNIYLGSNIGKSNISNSFLLERKFFSSGEYNFNFDLSGITDGVYVAYFKDDYNNKILGSSAIFKTNEQNKRRIYNNLGITN